MFKPLVFALFALWALPGFCQQVVKQPDLKAQYELPAGWTSQQYYKGDWDKSGGSGICHCALAVNILKVPNGDDFDYVHMVVYPSDKKGAADPQRTSVWQYKITHGEHGDSVKTSNLQWKHYTGKLTCQGDNRFKDCLAWKYQTHTDKTWYTVYFWGKPALMAQNKGVIEKIIAGFKTL
jgi:hypothetical protein